MSAYSWYYGTVMVPTYIHTRMVLPCFQSSVYSLTSVDDHALDHAVVDDYHTVCIYIHTVNEIIVLSALTFLGYIHTKYIPIILI